MTVTIFLYEDRALHLVDFLNKVSNVKVEIFLPADSQGFVRVLFTVKTGGDFLALYHAGIDFANRGILKQVS